MDLPKTVDLPLKQDTHGVLRVSDSRVPLETIIARYHAGDSPEVIHASFDVVPLRDVYAVIAYYLAHQAEVDEYIRHNDAEAERIRAEIEANYTPEQHASIERFRKLIEEKRRRQ